MSLNKTMKMEERADIVVSWLKDGANFVMFYIEEPDEQGHAYSPDSQRVFYFFKKHVYLRFFSKNLTFLY